MKRNYLFVILGAAILLTMNACKTELDLDDELKFSKLTVEEQKQKIEENGLEMVEVMNGIQDTKAMTTMMNMLEMTGAEVYGAPMQKLVADVKNHRRNSFQNFDKQMRVSYIDSEVWGEYDYNFDSEEIEKTKDLTNKIVVRFPATESATKNNAVITITYEASKIQIPETEEVYPSKLTYKMTVDAKEVMSANYEGSYYNDGSPKSVKQSVEIEDYSWAAEVTNDQKKATESYEFKNGSKTIIKTTAEINGVLTEDVITDSFEDGEPQDAISDFAAYFQVMDIAVKGGTSDLKGFADAMTALNENEKLSEKEMMEKQVELINKYMVCTALFVDDNRKFADVEFYVVEEVYEYSYYDYFLEKEVTESEIDYSIAPRFILSDGSKVDVEEYFQNGFNDLIEKIEDMVEDFE
jgi:hypothetical protein